jgi:hypothetical protein
MNAPLISPEYAKLNRELHVDSEAYGTSGGENLDLIGRYVDHFKPATILDYGCGKGLFKKAMQARAPFAHILEYDPAIPGKETCPPAADMVVCGDVLEHIEPDYLDNVLGHIKAVTNFCCIMTISHQPALKILSDGRNAHLIVQPFDWWQGRLDKHFFNIARIAHMNDPKSNGDMFSLVFATSQPLKAG